MHALHQVLHYFFNPHSFTLAMPDVWAGFRVNLKMMVIAEAFVLVLAEEHDGSHEVGIFQKGISDQ